MVLPKITNHPEGVTSLMKIISDKLKNSNEKMTSRMGLIAIAEHASGKPFIRTPTR